MGQNFSVDNKSAGRITFHKKLGAHDITVAQVLDGMRFVDFVQDHLQEKYGTPEAPIRPEFVKIIQSYIDAGFEWFSFDVIALEGDTKTRQPIEYRFSSDSIFYPMTISTLEQGKTKVDLLVFTEKYSTEFLGLSSDIIAREPQVDVTIQEVESLEKTWTGFFGGVSKIVMNQWTIEGNIEDFTKDVNVK